MAQEAAREGKFLSSVYAIAAEATLDGIYAVRTNWPNGFSTMPRPSPPTSRSQRSRGRSAL